MSRFQVQLDAGGTWHTMVISSHYLTVYTSTVDLHHKMIAFQWDMDELRKWEHHKNALKLKSTSDCKTIYSPSCKQIASCLHQTLATAFSADPKPTPVRKPHTLNKTEPPPITTTQAQALDQKEITAVQDEPASSILNKDACADVQDADCTEHSQYKNTQQSVHEYSKPYTMTHQMPTIQPSQTAPRVANYKQSCCARPRNKVYKTSKSQCVSENTKTRNIYNLRSHPLMACYKHFSISPLRCTFSCKKDLCHVSQASNKLPYCVDTKPSASRNGKCSFHIGKDQTRYLDKVPYSTDTKHLMSLITNYVTNSNILMPLVSSYKLPSHTDIKTLRPLHKLTGTSPLVALSKQLSCFTKVSNKNRLSIFGTKRWQLSVISVQYRDRLSTLQVALSVFNGSWQHDTSQLIKAKREIVGLVITSASPKTEFSTAFSAFVPPLGIFSLVLSWAVRLRSITLENVIRITAILKILFTFFKQCSLPRSINAHCNGIVTEASHQAALVPWLNPVLQFDLNWHFSAASHKPSSLQTAPKVFSIHEYKKLPTNALFNGFSISCIPQPCAKPSRSLMSVPSPLLLITLFTNIKLKQSVSTQQASIYPATLDSEDNSCSPDSQTVTSSQQEDGSLNKAVALGQPPEFNSVASVSVECRQPPIEPLSSDTERSTVTPAIELPTSNTVLDTDTDVEASIRGVVVFRPAALDSDCETEDSSFEQDTESISEDDRQTQWRNESPEHNHYKTGQFSFDVDLHEYETDSSLEDDTAIYTPTLQTETEWESDTSSTPLTTLRNISQSEEQPQVCLSPVTPESATSPTQNYNVPYNELSPSIHPTASTPLVYKQLMFQLFPSLSLEENSSMVAQHNSSVCFDSDFSDEEGSCTSCDSVFITERTHFDSGFSEDLTYSADTFKKCKDRYVPVEELETDNFLISRTDCRSPTTEHKLTLSVRPISHTTTTASDTYKDGMLHSALFPQKAHGGIQEQPAITTRRGNKMCGVECILATSVLVLLLILTCLQLVVLLGQLDIIHITPPSARPI